ncbi:hypothetical protein IPZ59_13895 [Mongoliitalea daihaiensis]|nr:hypothetical protein IPZ59_13895 [Mongoliitalea daihaiensis]
MKTKLLLAGQEALKAQILDIKQQLTDLQESSEIEEKSSAGDKYETHQEMLNQSREILQKRLSTSKLMLAQLNAVSVKPTDRIQEGAVFEVMMGNIWVSTPYGKLAVDGKDYQLVSQDSPLVQALWGKKKGESSEFRGKPIVIKDLY